MGPEEKKCDCGYFTVQSTLRSGRGISLAPEWGMEMGQRDRDTGLEVRKEDVATLVNQ